MDIVIFKELTTSDYLAELQVEADKYTGLYVDMDNAPEHKYVKDKANDIKQLLKKIDRKRIDASKEFKSKVEKEAADIIEKLKSANEPFTLLIDAYAAERAKILAEEKRINDERVAVLQFEDDHEMGLLINKSYEFDKAEELKLIADNEKRLKIEREKYADEQVKLAEERLLSKEARAKQVLINEENARLANKEHVQQVKTEIYKVLVQFGLSDADAKTVIHLATIKELPNLTINY